MGRVAALVAGAAAAGAGELTTVTGRGDADPLVGLA
jgi:hypothetical protein